MVDGVGDVDGGVGFIGFCFGLICEFIYKLGFYGCVDDVWMDGIDVYGYIGCSVF